MYCISPKNLQAINTGAGDAAVSPAPPSTQNNTYGEIVFLNLVLKDVLVFEALPKGKPNGALVAGPQMKGVLGGVAWWCIDKRCSF